VHLRLPKKIPKWVWFALAAVVFGVERTVAHHEPTTSTGGEVPATLTPANASQVADAIVKALKAMGRKVRRPESWLFPLAVSQLETDVPPRAWRQLYNYNVGNVTSGGRSAWYTNPHVGTSLKFRSFVSLLDGAKAMLTAMAHAGALDAADAGDLALFQRKMDTYNKGYAEQKGLDEIVMSLRGTIVEDVT
jgi:hypothetical protein